MYFFAEAQVWGHFRRIIKEDAVDVLQLSFPC